jgi:hypothetical protein
VVVEAFMLLRMCALFNLPIPAQVCTCACVQVSHAEADEMVNNAEGSLRELSNFLEDYKPIQEAGEALCRAVLWCAELLCGLMRLAVM